MDLFRKVEIIKEIVRSFHLLMHSASEWKVHAWKTVISHFLQEKEKKKYKGGNQPRGYYKKLNMFLFLFFFFPQHHFLVLYGLVHSAGIIW